MCTKLRTRPLVVALRLQMAFEVLGQIVARALHVLGRQARVPDAVLIRARPVVDDLAFQGNVDV